MIECEVQHCGRPANLDGLCLLHRRKEIAGQLEREGGLIWDTCAAGHRWTVENTHLESTGKGGTRRRCKMCLRAKAARRKMEEDPIVETPQPIRLDDRILAGAYGLFDEAQNHIDGLCKGSPEKWMDYGKDRIPTENQALLMCHGCPLMQACANSAIAQNESDPMQPAWGVWAGEVWVYGKRYEDGGKELVHDDD